MVADLKASTKASSNISGKLSGPSVVVPATSANLGCAFDCAAIALTLYLRVSATRKPSGFAVSYSGPNAADVPRDESNLIIKAMRHLAREVKVGLPGASIVVENEIPF